MSREIIVHDEARIEVIEYTYRIAEDSLRVSDCFVEAVNAAYGRLADMPGIGVSREYSNPRLKGMRMWPVPGFEKYLIFYRATDTELRVLRVLHGAQDIESLFAPEEEE
jgi:toxin ParE1/3/4